MQCHRCGADIGNRFGLCDKCKAAREPKSSASKDAVPSEQKASAPPSEALQPGDSKGRDYTEKKKPVSQLPTNFAGFWLRFFAGLIDLAILAIFGSAAMVVFSSVSLPILSGILSGFSSVSHNAGGIGQQVIIQLLIDMAGYLICSFVAYAILGLLYFATMESSSFQATPGKLAMGIFVTDLEGDRASFLASLKRHLLKFAGYGSLIIGILILVLTQEMSLAFIFLALLLIWLAPLLVLFSCLLAGFTEKRQAFHDIAAGCLVLRSEDMNATRIWGAAAGSVVLFIGTNMFLRSAIGDFSSGMPVPSEVVESAPQITYGREDRRLPAGSGSAAPLAFD